jgi:hypothetical protein
MNFHRPPNRTDACLRTRVEPDGYGMVVAAYSRPAV